MTADREALVAEVAGMLRRHNDVPDGNNVHTTQLEDALFNVWAGADDDVNDYAIGTMLAEAAIEAISPALADLLAAREQQARAEAVSDFRHWVARNRAYNGSEHLHGQSLYNECINGALATWAQAWEATT